VNLENEHLMPLQGCPYCGHRLDRAGGSGEQPDVGDIPVCIECGTALEVGPGRLLFVMNIDSLSPEELADVRKIQTAIAELRKATQ